ncbi:MAG: hypothetical protein K6B13_07800 [Prevotella sp.]|nr:hypothetical protein [Prevotella sp.]
MKKKNNTPEKTKVEKDIKKMENELTRMKKIGTDPRVVSAQETALNEKKKLLEDLAKQAKAEQGLFDKDTFLTFSIIDDDTLKITEKKYKVSFVKNNRPIDKKKVDGFIKIIANGKYEKAMPIIAITAKNAIENGYEVRDVDGHTVTEESADDFLVILDGQHRTLAFLKCNLTKERIVPSTYIKSGIDIGQYLVDINDVGTSWNQQDRFAVAALVTKDELAHEISDRISEKFNPTTAALIYTGKKISGAQVKRLLRGKEWTLPEGAKTDIERGNKFIQLCKEAGIEVKFITKRYFITGFNAYADSEGDNAAFEKLKGLRVNEKELQAVKDGTDFEALLKQVA